MNDTTRTVLESARKGILDSIDRAVESRHSLALALVRADKDLEELYCQRSELDAALSAEAS